MAGGADEVARLTHVVVAEDDAGSVLGESGGNGLADATGGSTFFPPSVEEMATSFKDVEEALRSQYALIYTPADFKADGAFRTIYLYCFDRSYQVRAKKGYFAPRQ